MENRRHIKVYHIVLLALFLTEMVVHSASAQSGPPSVQKNSYELLIPFIRWQAHSDGNLLCVVDDEDRLVGTNPSFSLFLVAKGSVLDSFSLEPYSEGGPSFPKALFIWKTSKGNVACLEYRSVVATSSGGEYTSFLLLFKFSEGKLGLLTDSVSTDELYENNRDGEY